MLPSNKSHSNKSNPSAKMLYHDSAYRQLILSIISATIMEKDDQAERIALQAIRDELISRKDAEGPLYFHIKGKLTRYGFAIEHRYCLTHEMGPFLCVLRSFSLPRLDPLPD